MNANGDYDDQETERTTTTRKRSSRRGETDDDVDHYLGVEGREGLVHAAGGPGLLPVFVRAVPWQPKSQEGLGEGNKRMRGRKGRSV